MTQYNGYELNYSIEELKVEDVVSDELIEFYKEVEFESFIKKVNQKKISVLNSYRMDIIQEQTSLFLVLEMMNIYYLFRGIFRDMICRKLDLIRQIRM